MRIGLYAFPVRGGGGRYFWHLAQLLPRLGPHHEYVVYLEGALPKDWRPLKSSIKIRLLPYDQPAQWSRIQVDLPRLLRRDRIDLFHAQYQRFPFNIPCKSIVVIHDIVPLLDPAGTMSPGRRRPALNELRVAARLADHFIASSEYTRHQLATQCNIPLAKISQIHLGCSDLFRPIPKKRAKDFVKLRFRIEKPFLLSVGPLIPRKNHLLLIQAYRKALLWKKFDLVISGETGWRGKHVLGAIRHNSRIHYVGPVSDTDLVHLYATAECLIYPSREEGFGLPPLEAMACGTPVVASNCSSIPEVVGHAALLVEPNSTPQLAKAMKTLTQDASLQAQLRQRGFERIKKFRWEETARRTLHVYERLMLS